MKNDYDNKIHALKEKRVASLFLLFLKQRKTYGAIRLMPIAPYGLRLTVLFLVQLVALSLSYAFPANANPLEGYCISKQGQKAESKPPLPIEPAQVSFSVKGKSFRVVVHGKSDRLELKDEENKVVSYVNARQEAGDISRLVLDKKGWLWIDGDYTDYIAQLDLTKLPPTIAPPIRLSELKEKPCSSLGCWGSYGSAHGHYSTFLDRVIITGHRVTPFGSPWPAAVEVVAGKLKPLPEQLNGAELLGLDHQFVLDKNEVVLAENGLIYYHAHSYYQDFPHLNGLLFRGYNGDALFYDGSWVTSLFNDTLEQSVVGLEKRKWGLSIAPISKRVFLNKSALYYRPPYFVELKAGPHLTPIDMPDSLTYFMLYEFSSDLQLFAVGRRTVAAEIRGTVTTDIGGIKADSALRTVIIVPEPSYITGGYIQQAPDGTIRLGVHNPETKTDTDYFIVRKSPSTSCIATLNPKKPILIDNE